MKNSLLPLLPLLALAPASPAAPSTLKTERFDRDPGWEEHHNRIVPKKTALVTQDFGYSATHFAGQAVGEVGGVVRRSTTPAMYGAPLTPPKSLADKLTASGTFAITKSQPGAGVFFGFFHSKQPGGSGRPIGSLGLDFDFEGTGGRLAVRLITDGNRSCGTFITPYLPGKFRPTPIKADGTRYHWTLDYDPQAAEGRGRFTFTLRSETHTAQDYGQLPEPSEREAQARFPNTTTFTVDLPPGHQAEGATFDRFGMMNLMKAGGAATLFFDDVKFNGAAQDFTRDPGWIGAGNRASFEDRELVGAHDFGFSAGTSHAGGTPGEVGGGLWRSGDFGYYADRVGPLNLEQRLEARGKVKLITAGPDSDMRLGWFSSGAKEKQSGEVENFVGITVGGPTRIGHYFLPAFATAKGTRGKVDQGPVLAVGRVLDWSLLYDPMANGGIGEMRATLGGETATLALKPGQKAEGATLDRFGLFTSTAGGQMVKIYLDDLQYTTAGREAADAGAGTQTRILPGHAGSVLGLAFSPDGRVLVSGSRDKTMKLWNAHTGALQRTLTDHTADVYAVDFSAGGELLASCGADKTIRIWDTKAWEVKTVLQGHTDIVRAAAFSPDAKVIASVSVDQTVRLWDVASARLKRTLTGHTARVKSLAWSPDGKTLATVSTDKTLRLWDAHTGGPKGVLEGHTGDIETVAWSRDGKTLATSSNDTTVRLWDAATGQPIRTLAGHSAEVDGVIFSPDGKMVVSGSKDTMIKFWNRETGVLMRTLTGHTGRVESLAFSPDGRILATGGGGGDTSIRVWDVAANGK